jgi:hypothetical protein
MKKIIAVLLALLLGCAFLEFRPRLAHAQSDAAVVPLGALWNKGSTNASTNLFTTDLKTTRATSVIRIGVVVGSSVKLSVKETNGAQTFTSSLNGGSALAAGSLYTFTWEARNSDGAGNAVTFNFVMDGTSTVPILRVTEVVAAVD